MGIEFGTIIATAMILNFEFHAALMENDEVQVGPGRGGSTDCVAKEGNMRAGRHGN
jgi:hypothetical protein